MAKVDALFKVLEQEQPNGNGTLSSQEFADTLLKGLGVKAEKGQDPIPVPDTETITIEEVDGEEVRDKYDQDFTSGGNEGAYPEYVPKGKLWRENGHDLEGKLAINGHEFLERMIMLYLGWDYEPAHALCANPGEAIIRWAARQTSWVKEESLFASKANPVVEEWIKVWDEIFNNKGIQKRISEAMRREDE